LIFILTSLLEKEEFDKNKSASSQPADFLYLRTKGKEVMKLDTIHHIAIIGHDYAKTKTFYVDKLGFEMLDEHHRSDKEDILFNVRKGNLTLEIFIKEKAPKRPFLPHPEHTGLRHLAFRVTDVEATLTEFDRLDIPHTELRHDDFDGRKMAFFFDPDGLPLELHE